MVLSVNFRKLFGLNSKPLCLYAIKVFCLENKAKRLIKNWMPISLLNIDAKLISKVLTKRNKKHLTSLTSSNQTAYMDKRFISEGGRLSSDILEITDQRFAVSDRYRENV